MDDYENITKIGGWVIAGLLGLVAMLFRNGLLKRLERVEDGQQRIEAEITDIRAAAARIEGRMDERKVG